MRIHQELTPVGVKTAAALGYFDGVHRGHAEIIRRTVEFAKKMWLRPTVFTFDFADARPGEKGAKDLFSKEEKYALLESLGIELCVEVDFQEVKNITDRKFIDGVLGHGCLNAAAVFCGEDFRYGRARTGDVRSMRRLSGPLGIQVNAMPFLLDDGVISTTRIKRLVGAGDMPAAARLLGRPYTVGAPVTAGAESARRGGFSQLPGGALELPKFGVYSSAVRAGEERHDAVTYVGRRPSLTGGETVWADTRLLEGGTEFRTGGEVRVELLRWMRAEDTFKDREALYEAIGADIRRAKLRA